MAFQSIGLGTSADDGTGDSLRVGGDKVNDNFSEIYTLLGTGSALTTGLSTTASVVTLSSAVGTFTTLTPAASDGTALGSASLEFSDLFLADASTIKFGADQDVILTHVADTGLLLNAAMKIQFRDAAIHISSTADGDLSIAADDEIDLTSTLIDINGNVEISGTLAQADTVTMATNKKIQFRDTAIHISSTADGDLAIAADDEIDLTSTLIDINGNVEISGTTAQVGVLTTTATQVATGGITSGSDIVSDTDSTDDLGTTGVRWANLFVDAITATDQITATGFTGTLDGILGSGAAAAATTTTLDTSGVVNLNLTTDSTSSTSGALIIDGGVGVAKKLFVGTDLDVDGAVDVAGNSVLASVDVTGVATAATFEPDGDTAAGDNAAIGYTAAEGLILTGEGSTSDVTIKNDADATVLSIPTGTTKVGIGLTNPTGQFAVSDGTVNLELNPTSSIGFMGTRSAHDVVLTREATEKMRVTTTGITVTGTAALSAGSNSFAHLGGTVTGDGGARDLGTNYTNSTAFDKLTYVSVSNTAAQALLSFIIGGVSVFMGAGATGDANYFIAATIIWPAGKVVQVNMNGTPTLQRWVEFA